MRIKFFYSFITMVALFTAGCKDKFNPVDKSNPIDSVENLPTKGLVAYYPFDGNANDKSGNNYHGVVNGAILATDRFGKANKSYSFDGFDDYISVNNVSNTKLEPSKEITISVFIYPTSSHGNAPWSRIVRKCANFDNGYVLSWDQDSNGLLQSMLIFNSKPEKFETPADYISCTNSFLLERWHHVAMTYSVIDKILKLYVDGDLIVSQQNCKYDFQHSRNFLFIGGSIGNLAVNGRWVYETFPGSIDDVRIYERALSVAEIQQLYHEGGYKL